MKAGSISEKVRIRRARPEDAARLTELTVRSKSQRGYDADFLADAASELRFEPSKFLPDFHVYLLESEDGLAGFCDLVPMDEEHIELHDRFIEPKHSGQGYGRQLWAYAVNLARQLGFRVLVLTADPNAEPFNERQEAVRVGEKVSPFDPAENCRSWSTGVTPLRRIRHRRCGSAVVKLTFTEGTREVHP